MDISPVRPDLLEENGGQVLGQVCGLSLAMGPPRPSARRGRPQALGGWIAKGRHGGTEGEEKVRAVLAVVAR